MKNIISYSAKLLIALVGFALTLASCSKYREVAPADYPSQIIYMPAANFGYYQINNIPQPIGSDPTLGEPFRFIVDLANKKFIVPLSVYRAGVNNDGEFKVDIAINTDTITNLINSGGVTNTVILPSEEYSIPSFVNMLDGEQLVPFNLSIDLDSLRNNFGEKFALAVSISSTQRESNSKLSTTILIIDTKILKPTAGFTFNEDASDSSQINFKNASLSSVSNSWNFGDGSPVVTDLSPSHTFSGPGIYIVTLTSIGITGDEDKSIKSAEIVIL